MLQKYESSIGAGLLFDACPWCGFAGGTQDAEEATPEHIWEAIYEHHRVESKEQLIKDLNLEEYVSEEDSDFYPSIFDYSKQLG
jgi:hypothetical protein